MNSLTVRPGTAEPLLSSLLFEVSAMPSWLRGVDPEDADPEDPAAEAARPAMLVAVPADSACAGTFHGSLTPNTCVGRVIFFMLNILPVITV